MEYPIELKVVTDYQKEDSEPHNNYFLFNYQVTIYNGGDEQVTLLYRHWIITDGDGERKEIKGKGVVGGQPSINPRDSYQYSSSVNFKTPVGSLFGTYRMKTESGKFFNVTIPPFGMGVPGVLQ